MFESGYAMKIVKRLTSQRRVVFDTIVDVDIAQIEGIGLVISIQDASNVVGNEPTEARREVVDFSNLRFQLAEGDVLSIVG